MTRIPSLGLLGLATTVTFFSGSLAQERRYPDCGPDTIGIHCIAMHNKIGPWEIEEVVPPVGTQNALTMISYSFQKLPGIFGRNQPAVLRLSCVENRTSFEVQFGENFMSDVGEFRKLIYKVDDLPPVALDTDASPDNTALGIYSGSGAIRLIRSMFGHQRLLVSATTFTGRNLNASFSIEGLEEAVQPLRELCNW
jgi:type VI secretion system protein VasI